MSAMPCTLGSAPCHAMCRTTAADAAIRRGAGHGRAEAAIVGCEDRGRRGGCKLTRPETASILACRLGGSLDGRGWFPTARMPMGPPIGRTMRCCPTAPCGGGRTSPGTGVAAGEARAPARIASSCALAAGDVKDAAGPRGDVGDPAVFCARGLTDRDGRVGTAGEEEFGTVLLAAWPGAGAGAGEGTAAVGFGGTAAIGDAVATEGMGYWDCGSCEWEGGGDGFWALVRAGQAGGCFDCCVWDSSSECGSSSSRSLSRLTGGVVAMVGRGVNAADVIRRLVRAVAKGRS